MHISLGDLVFVKTTRSRGIVVEKNPSNNVNTFAQHLQHIYDSVYYVLADSCYVGPYNQSELKLVQKTQEVISINIDA
jgi:hypothetical protein